MFALGQEQYNTLPFPTRPGSSLGQAGTARAVTQHLPFEFSVQNRTGNSESRKPWLASIKARAQERAENLRAIVADVRNSGHTGLRDIAAELNLRAILTPRGGEWHATSVVRLPCDIGGHRQMAKHLKSLATPAGFEPATFSLEGCCSIP